MFGDSGVLGTEDDSGEMTKKKRHSGEVSRGTGYWVILALVFW